MTYSVASATTPRQFALRSSFRGGEVIGQPEGFAGHRFRCWALTLV